jgi:hypothetical protein
MLEPTGGKLRPGFSWLSRHVLDNGAWRNRCEGTRAEHEDRLLAVGPLAEGQHCLERLAANDQCVHRGHELIVAMGFAAAGLQKIEVTVGSTATNSPSHPIRTLSCASVPVLSRATKLSGCRTRMARRIRVDAAGSVGSVRFSTMSRARSANTKYRGPDPPFFVVTMISAPGSLSLTRDQVSAGDPL